MYAASRPWWWWESSSKIREMPVRYDPLLTRLLAREIDRRWRGIGVWSLGMDPERSTASIRFADGSALVSLFERTAGHVVPMDEDPLGDDGVRVTRFGRMSLRRVEAPDDERAIVLTLAEDDGTVAAGIAIELHTNRWNVLALSPSAGSSGGDPTWRVRYALWTREIAGRRVGPGEPYSPPESSRRGLDSAPTESEWSDWLRTHADTRSSYGGRADRDPLRTSVLETWAWASVLNIEWLLADPAKSCARYAELHALAGELETRQRDEAFPVWLTNRRWGDQPYPARLGEMDAPEHPDVLMALGAALAAAGGPKRLLEEDGGDAADEVEQEQLARRLESRRDREAKRVAALTRQLDAAGSPDAARELGQILLARKDGIARGATTVTLQAFDGSLRDIALDPTVDAIANAERFFEEARRRERALQRLPSEIASAETRLAAFTGALERLAREGPNDRLWDLVGGRPVTKRKRGGRRTATEPEQRLPYTRLLSSNGLEIRVGRGSRDNDALTFRHSAPDDIWLHATQSSGAHVVLRWGRRDENPPQRDLTEAAIAAAVHSGARHSGTVAVSWTRRKYVRKPRKAAPGAVVPDRVKTLLVEPDEALVRALREAAADPT